MRTRPRSCCHRCVRSGFFYPVCNYAPCISDVNSKLNVLLPERVRFFRSERVVGVSAVFCGIGQPTVFAVNFADAIFFVGAGSRWRRPHDHPRR